jgi:hypothetical protein
VRRLPPIVRSMTRSILREKSAAADASGRQAVRFSFKGFRRGLLYDPRAPARQIGPYRPIAPGWFLSLS